MGQKIAFLVALVITAILGGTTVAFLMFPPNESNNHPTVTSAVKVSMPIDLAGRWESAPSKIGSKMVAQVKDGTIHVEMYVDQGYTGLWYGTFDILQPGENTLVSKAIDDPNHFVLSTAKEKEFVYQGSSLIFDYSVMGTRTTVEMRRVAG